MRELTLDEIDVVNGGWAFLVYKIAECAALTYTLYHLGKEVSEGGGGTSSENGSATISFPDGKRVDVICGPNGGPDVTTSDVSVDC